MKKQISLILILIIGLISSNAYATKISGKYELVGKLESLKNIKKVELVEYFNFSCGHCYHFLTTSKRLEKKYKDKLVHRSVPIFWGKQNALPTIVYLIGKDHGKGELAKNEIFNTNFQMKADIFNYRIISYVASTLGFGEEFDKKSNSPEMRLRVDALLAESSRYNVDQTPTIVLNGVIKVNPGMTDGSTDKMTDNLDRIIEDMLRQ